MSVDMQAFVFEGEAIRFVGTADAPEWVAADVCTVLGIAEAPSVLRDFEDDERGLRSMQGADGRPRDMLTVTEPGLYRLVFRSRKPDAVRFRRWVTHEVLPAIRRTGSYGSPSALAAVEARVAALEARATASTPDRRPRPRTHAATPADHRFASFRDPHFDPDSAPVPVLRRRVHPYIAPLLRDLLCALRDTVGTEGVAVTDGYNRAPRLALALKALGSSSRTVGILLGHHLGFRYENLVLDHGWAKRAMPTLEAPAKRTTATWRARVAPPEAKPTAPRDRFLFADVPTAAELDLAASD